MTTPEEWLAAPPAGTWKSLARSGQVPEFMRVSPNRGENLSAALGAFWFLPGGGFEVLAMSVECKRCGAPAGTRCGPITHPPRVDHAIVVESRIRSRCPDPDDLEPGRSYVELGVPVDPRPRSKERR